MQRSTVDMGSDYAIYAHRRQELVMALMRDYPGQKGIVFLCAGFEQDRFAFRQESSFFYMTGIEEPGAALIGNGDGDFSLYLPHYAIDRTKWLNTKAEVSQKYAQARGFCDVQYLGQPSNAYQIYPYFEKEQYECLLKHLELVISKNGYIFTLMPNKGHHYEQQRLVLDRIFAFVPEFSKRIIDISSIIHAMRRSKSTTEIEKLYKAADITVLAHEAAAQAIRPGVIEYEVQAAIEYIFIGSGARAAFPSIVASGKNATILHYIDNNRSMQSGELVVIDIGANYEYYCADVTRTYPVSGKFSERQKELYSIVLETQYYIASLARPGYWLSNADVPDRSLHHLAKQYLQDRGYADYFIHGIGHYLGLDVHDVGDYKSPLQEGDVITIEPGIYIPEESIGIRIEDNYWIVKDGNVCLTDFLPKKIDDIEAMMKDLCSADGRD